MGHNTTNVGTYDKIMRSPVSHARGSCVASVSSISCSQHIGWWVMLVQVDWIHSARMSAQHFSPLS